MIKSVTMGVQTPEYRKLLDWKPERGDTFVNRDGSLVLLVLSNSRVIYLEGRGRTLSRLRRCPILSSLDYRRCDIAITEV